MATKKIYDLAVKVGEYPDGSGGTKGRYQNVGVILQKDDGGKFIMLERWFNPAGVPDLSGRGGSTIMVSMFPPKDGNGQAAAAPAPAPRQQRAAVAPADDDIPF